MKDTLAEYTTTFATLKDGENTPIQVDAQGYVKVASNPKSLATNRSASALIKTGSGQAYGVVINSHTTGTLKLWDNTSAAGTVLFNTISFAVGERFIPLLGATFSTGLYATIGGTADITILYN